MDRQRLSAVVADHDRDVAQLVGLNLELQGFRGLTVENGRQCARLAQKVVPGLVILGLGLPVIDGLSHCHGIRSSLGMPTILTSDTKNTEDMVR